MGSCLLGNDPKDPCIEFYIVTAIGASLLVVVLVQAVFLIVCGLYLRKKNRTIKTLQGLSREERNGNEDTKSDDQTATDSEVKSSSTQQLNVLYKSQKQTVTIHQDIDAMYDVVHEDIGKTSLSPPTAQGGPQADYDVLHSTENKAEATEMQPQQTLPPAEYAVINKSYITAKAMKSSGEQPSNGKSKPINKQKKGKKKTSQQEQFDDPPPIPPQMYQYEDELLPNQAPMQQTSQSESVDVPSASVNQTPYPDATYDVITH